MGSLVAPGDVRIGTSVTGKDDIGRLQCVGKRTNPFSHYGCPGDGSRGACWIQSMFKAAVSVPQPCPRDCPSQLRYPLQVTKLFLSTGNSCVCLGGWVLTSIEGQRPGYAVSAMAWGSQLPRDPALGV